MKPDDSLQQLRHELRNRRQPSPIMANEDDDTRIRYYRTGIRDIKIPHLDPKKELQVEIEEVIQNRKSNLLRHDHKRDIQSKGYKIKNNIGSGSYAHVFRAKDLRTNREVAIKLIELDKCSRHYKDVCLRNEIRVIRELSHENIVRFYEAFNTNMAYVMVMELVDNGTFADFLHKNGALNDDQVRKLFRGVFLGLNYMHQRLIAHRDLKLENLLLNRNYEPKIVDFSLSVIWDGKKLCSDWCGTPPYFSPEILQRTPYDPLGYDIWSLGVCIYVMICDTIPFNCADDKEMLQKQLNRDWKFRARYEKNTSEELKNLIRQMLEPDMFLRIRIGQILQVKWCQIQNKTPTKKN